MKLRHLFFACSGVFVMMFSLLLLVVIVFSDEEDGGSGGTTAEWITHIFPRVYYQKLA